MPTPVSRDGLTIMSTPSFTLGVASPCSTCTNRRTSPVNNLPACPRAEIAQRQLDAQANGSNFTQFEHLTLTGLEANPFATAAPGALVNPVYDEGNNSLYIWVARLVDNQGAVTADGTGDCPPLTDPTFLTNFTDHIQCMPLPMVPSDTLAQYYIKGRIKEGENVMITAFEGQQVDPSNVTEVYGGVVSKLAIHKSFPVTARPVKDDHPRGT